MDVHGECAPGLAHRWLALVIVSLGMFMVELDSTVVSVALPSIQHALHFSAAHLQWVVNAYLLAFGGFLLLSGRVSDRVGTRRTFVTGMLAFLVGSAINALTPSAPLLIVGRGLQGLGGATLTPTTLSTVNRMFADPAERSRALGVWTAIQIGSVALGLILGGVITSALSWRWIFTLNLPVAAAAVVGALGFVPEHRFGGERGFDVAGAVAITGALGFGIFGLTNSAAWGWASPRTAGCLGGATLLIIVFLLIEGRTRQPMLPLSILRVRTLAAGNVGFLLTSGGMYGAFFFSSLYAQEVLGYGALRAGVALLPLTVGVLVGAGASQPLLRSTNMRAPALLGLGVGVVGALLLTRISASGPYASSLLPGLSLIAIGLGLAMVPFTMLSTSGVDGRDAGIASGLYTATSYTGGAVGLAVLSTVASGRTARALHHLTSVGQHAQALALVDGYREAFLVSAAMLAAAAVLTAAWLRRGDAGPTAEA